MWGFGFMCLLVGVWMLDDEILPKVWTYVVWVLNDENFTEYTDL